MKIKEVMEKTGLTDRAIRLYISYGLVTPVCHRSYTGRNNYSFSEEDVARLKKVALLRKADFSLEQIKNLQQQDTAVLPILRECLAQKQSSRQKEQAVVDALEELCAISAPTLDMVYFRLSECFRKQPPCVKEEQTFHEEPERAIFLKYIGVIVAAMFGVALTTAFLFYGIYTVFSLGDVYETAHTDNYLEIRGNYDNEKPEAFIRSFFPEEIEDSFSQVVYHYKAKKLDAYAYECYLEFVIEDPDAYKAFIEKHTDEEVCTTFSYDKQFREQSISNVLYLHQSEDKEAVYHIETAELGKILFCDQQQRVIFVAIGMYDGGGANTVELGHFFCRFQIDPWEYSRSAYPSGFAQEKGITNEARQ